MADDATALAAPAQPDAVQANAAPDANPFDQVDTSATASAAPASDNPFDAIGPAVQPGSSVGGAFLRSAERSALPSVGGLVGAGLGAEAGSELGALAGAGVGAIFGGIGAGPGAVVGGIGGAIAGGIGGAMGGSAVTEKAQDWGMTQLPESWKDALGQSDRQQMLDQRLQPTATFVGGIAPYVLSMRPGGWGAISHLPANATAWQRLAANPVTGHLFSGAVMGGMEAGNELVAGQSPDWAHIGIATGFGMVFNKPTRFGEKLTEIGASPMRKMLGKTAAEPTPANTNEPAPAPVAEAAAAPVEPSPPVSAKDWNETILGQKQPTVAQAGDAKVMGPGITEDVFLGAHEQAPEAQMTTQDAARSEASVIGPPQEAPAVHEVARHSHPELFSEYDALSAQRADLTAHLASIAKEGFEQTPEQVAVEQHLKATDDALRTLAPQVGAAYRRAADLVGSPTIEPELAPETPETPQNSPETVSGNAPEPSPAGPVAATVQEQAAAIAADVTQRLIAAGRPAEEAQASGRLIASHYQARAARFGGAIGSPMDLYRAHGPRIKGVGTKPPLMPTAEAPNFPPRTASLASRDEALVSDAGTYAGPRQAAVNIGGKVFASGTHVEALEKALKYFGPNSDEISAFERDPESFIGMLSGAPGRTPLDNIPYDKGFTITRVSGINSDAAEVRHALQAATTSTQATNGIEALDPKTIGVDARRFQFKEGGDESGVTERLQGVEKWDPRLAGTALVFRDADGRDWIADGHQRLALATRLSAGQPDIRLNAFVLSAADGITDEAARAIAAAKNIAEGTGTAIDAAKIIRIAKDKGEELPPLPPRSALVRDGHALAELSPDAFGMVVNELVPPSQGAMVGRLVKDPLAQVEALRILTHAKPENAQQAEMIVRDMLGSGTEQMTRQDSLFGEEAFASSIVLERAKVADEAIKQLRKDKATFSTLVKEADRIQGAGENVLDQAANTSRLTTDEKASDLLTQLAFRAGPVSDALSAVARRLKSGDIRPAEAAREFLGVVRSAVESGVDTGADAGGAQPGAAGQREELATEPSAEGLPQTLLPGVAPVTDLERANLDAARPLQGGDAAPGGLFDEDAQNQRELFQPAYHGTPHIFDKFSTDKIGTGEGNQTYGHGLYFASKKDVALAYRRALSKPAIDVIEDVVSKAGKPRAISGESDVDFFARRLEKYPSTSNLASNKDVLNDMVAAWRGDDAAWDRLRGKVPDERTHVMVDGERVDAAATGADPKSVAIRFLTTQESKERAVAVLRSSERTSGSERMRAVYGDAANWIETTPNLEVKAPGRLYHVDVPEEHELLNWDKPLSEQPEGVREKINSLGLNLDEVAKDLFDGKADDLTGEMIYNAIASKLAPTADGSGDPSAASRALAEAGIPGHQYVGHESQSTNYVIYDDSRVPITNYEQGKRGSITFAPGKKPIIKLFQDANASTFIHETGHQWLEELMADAKHPMANDGIRNDAQTVSDWLGMEEAGAPIKTAQHEKFARGFEQYMREGVAPSPGLASVFAKFKSWLTAIYQSLKGLGTPINEDIRGVFDRLLAEEPNRTVIAPEREDAQSLASLHELDAAQAHPAEAEPIGDRIAAERDRYVAQQHPEILNELARAEAERAAAAEPAGETGASGEGRPAVGLPGSDANAEPAGGGSGGERGPEQQGSGVGMAESAGAPAGDGSAARAGDEPGLRQQRPEPLDAARSQPLAPEPANHFGASASPFLDPAGNIRTENLTTSADVAQAIHDAADANNDFIGDRRGVVTDGQVMDLAEALGMDAGMLQRRQVGQAFNAEQIVAARKLLIQSATQVSDLMKKAAIGTDEDVMAYAMAKDRHQMIQGQVAGITAEAGRALRAFRNISGQDAALGVDQFLRTATGKTLFQLRLEAKLGATLDTPERVSKFVNDAKKRGFWDMLLEYYVNNLISGLATHATYTVGNTLLAIEKAGPETAAAALIGAARRATGREGEIVHMGEVGAQFRAAAASLPMAAKAAAEAFKTGVTTRLPGEDAKAMPFQPGSEFAPSTMLDENFGYGDVIPGLYSAIRGIRDGIIAGGALAKAGGVRGSPMIGARYSPLGAIPDIAVRGIPVIPIGTAVRLPSRFVGSIHSFFRATNYSMAKNALAYRAATEAGLTGVARDARMADIRQNPTPEIMDQSRSSATQLTLMGQGSEFFQALSKLTNVRPFGIPLGKFVAPFVKIGGNIIDQALVQRTPLGLLAPEVRADLMGKNGTVAQDTAQARMLVGSSLAIAFGSLAAQGLVSGSGPSDPDQSALWRLAGNQAHSVLIHGTWYDVHRLGPMGMLASISADMYDVSHAASEGDMNTAAAGLLHAFTQTIMDEGWMSGPSQLMQALEDPGRYGAAYVRNQIAPFIPFEVGMGQMARATDPYSRQARTIVDAIKAKIPGMSETLMPRRDVFGEPIPNLPALGGRALSAIYASKVNNDPVIKAMLNLGVFPGPAEKKIRNVLLTPEQYDDYARLSGRMMKMRLDVIVNSPDFRTWPPSSQHDVIVETVRQSREIARGLMMAKYPSIVSTATQQKLAKFTGTSTAP